MTTKTRTYGRGILRFTSLQPCRRPGQTAYANAALKKDGTVNNSRVQNGGEMHVHKNGGGVGTCLVDRAVQRSKKKNSARFPFNLMLFLKRAVVPKVI